MHGTEVRECALRLSGVVRGVAHGRDDEASLEEVGGVPHPEGRAQERDDVPGAHPQEDRALDRRCGRSVNDDGPTQPHAAGRPGEPLVRPRRVVMLFRVRTMRWFPGPEWILRERSSSGLSLP